MKAILPLALLALLLAVLALFTYFEAVYLADQARQLGRSGWKVAIWMWVFRVVTLVFASGTLYLVWRAVREITR